MVISENWLCRRCGGRDFLLPRLPRARNFCRRAGSRRCFYWLLTNRGGCRRKSFRRLWKAWTDFNVLKRRLFIRGDPVSERVSPNKNVHRQLSVFKSGTQGRLRNRPFRGAFMHIMPFSLAHGWSVLNRFESRDFVSDAFGSGLAASGLASSPFFAFSSVSVAADSADAPGTVDSETVGG